MKSFINADSLKVIVPIITFFLGTIYSVFTNRKQQKINNRALPHVEEAYYSLDLKNNRLKDPSKLYMCGDYSEIYGDPKTDRSAEIIYIKVTNLGPGHMLNCDFFIETLSIENPDKKWKFQVHIPYIKKEEIILIPTLKKDMYNVRVITNKIRIEYLTATQERMEYNSQLEKVDGADVEINESLHVKKKLIDTKIYGYKGKKSLFVFVTPNK